MNLVNGAMTAGVPFSLVTFSWARKRKLHAITTTWM
jgi:hypothetical protein